MSITVQKSRASAVELRRPMQQELMLKIYVMQMQMWFLFSHMSDVSLGFSALEVTMRSSGSAQVSRDHSRVKCWVLPRPVFVCVFTVCCIHPHLDVNLIFKYSVFSSHVVNLLSRFQWEGLSLPQYQCRLCHLSPHAVMYKGTHICCVWINSFIPSYEYQMAPKVTALMDVLAAMQSARWCMQCLCLFWQGADERGSMVFMRYQSTDKTSFRMFYS